jgi:hypothetical protein
MADRPHPVRGDAQPPERLPLPKVSVLGLILSSHWLSTRTVLLFWKGLIMVMAFWFLGIGILGIVVIIAGSFAGDYAAPRIVIWLRNRSPAPLRTVILRRFEVKASEWMRRIVAPTFGAYGTVRTAFDSTYAEGRQREKIYDLEEVEKIADALAQVDVAPRLQNETWRDDVVKMIGESDLCVVDISDLSEFVAWELGIAIHLKPVARIIPVAMSGRAVPTIADLERMVRLAALTDRPSKLQGNECLRDRLASIADPVIYGWFPRSTLFRLRIYLRLRRISMLENRRRPEPLAT